MAELGGTQSTKIGERRGKMAFLISSLSLVSNSPLIFQDILEFDNLKSALTA